LNGILERGKGGIEVVTSSGGGVVVAVLSKEPSGSGDVVVTAERTSGM
jgi:hypothetical protein